MLSRKIEKWSKEKFLDCIVNLKPITKSDSKVVNENRRNIQEPQMFSKMTIFDHKFVLNNLKKKG